MTDTIRKASGPARVAASSTPNERVTERLVRQHLENHMAAAHAEYWEQTPDNERIKQLLKGASKSGKGGGFPDFTVAFHDQTDFLLAIECKANESKHESPSHDQPPDYAVDGALHYARHMSKEYNVLAIAVSGMQPPLSVSHFWHLQGERIPKPTDFPTELLPLSQYLRRYREDSIPRQHGLQSLEVLARRLNGKLHSLKIAASHRALLVSAILVALKEDKAFRDSYKSLDGSRLLSMIRDTIIAQMKCAGVEAFGLMGINTSYAFMTDAGMGELTAGRHLADIVADLEQEGLPVLRRLGHYDAIGRFYLEFLRYSNNDAELGIVLTPPHITELAADLAEVGKDDIAFDNCAGTGGFLISAMKQMIADTKGDEKKQAAIKRGQIFGLEHQASIFSLLSSNMFLHGDGRSNMKQGNCFDPKNIEWAKMCTPTVGFLNPPFKHKDRKATDTEEMEFVLNNMEALKRDGNSRCVALLPMPWARAAKGGKQLQLKRKALSKHTLEAVISLPDGLFYNSDASVVTCLMVFRAHRPHSPTKNTWFAYGKDDGFEMRHHFGRVDHDGLWGEIRGTWLERFANRRDVTGFSISRHVGAEDEWCAEAYIKLDYTALTHGDFQCVLRDFILAKKMAEWPVDNAEKAILSPRLVSLKEIFAIERGHGLSYNQQEKDPNGVNFVARGSVNNGVRGRIVSPPGVAPKPAGMLTVAASGSVLETFLQTAPFYTGVGTICLTPHRDMSDQMKLFYCMLIRANKFRYNYGREANASLGDVELPTPDSIPAWVEDVRCD